MLHARKDFDRIQDPAGLIPEDEPVFLIRAQDMASADTLRFWARKNLELGGNEEISMLAEAFALKMERWGKKKLADMPPCEGESKPIPLDVRHVGHVEFGKSTVKKSKK